MNKVKGILTGAKKEVLAFIILKGVTWTAIAVTFAFFGSYLDKLWIVDDVLLILGILNTWIVFKNPETRATLFKYYATINNKLKELL